MSGCPSPNRKIKYQNDGKHIYHRKIVIKNNYKKIIGNVTTFLEFLTYVYLFIYF